MSFGLRFRYQQIFEETRPGIYELLQNIPSKAVVYFLAVINDTLLINGASRTTQILILNELIDGYPSEIKDKIAYRAIPLIMSGYILFAQPYTMDLLNWELSNFRDKEYNEADFETNEINILKALVAIIDESTEKDLNVHQDAIEAAKLGGENLIKLMWPHLIKQFEFANNPDAIFECYKGMAFISYIERHPKFSPIAASYFEKFGCSCGQDYLHRLISVIVPYLQRENDDNPIDYFFRVKVSSSEPALEALVISPQEIQNNPDKLIDYRGLKEKPLFKFGENEYVIPYWHYFLNALFTGLLFSFYRNSGVSVLFNELPEGSNNKKVVDDGLGKFKGVIGKEFSEAILFKNTMTTCFSRKHETLRFFEDDEKFNPDCYYRQGNHIFIIEFKDYLLKSEVIQSNSYDKIKEEIDNKFVSYSTKVKGKIKVKEKGISQLARNIELLYSDEDLFWKIDSNAMTRKLKLRNMNIHPIIIQTNIYFDIPGINEYLNEIIQQRLKLTSNAFRSIRPFTMINFQYFFDRLLLFADSKLELSEELECYHDIVNKLKLKVNKTAKIHYWFNSLMPFSFLKSPNFKKHFEYRREDLLDEIKNCWLIDD